MEEQSQLIPSDDTNMDGKNVKETADEGYIDNESRDELPDLVGIVPTILTSRERQSCVSEGSSMNYEKLVDDSRQKYACFC